MSEIRPICRSINPKLIHTHPDLLKARAFSYSLVILIHPTKCAQEKLEAAEAMAKQAELSRAGVGVVRSDLGR